jgi:hypothetical protein
MEAHQVAAALAGVVYPARRWQLLAQADHYGADVHTRAELSRLPEGLYPDLATVIATIAAGLSNRHLDPRPPCP